MTAYYVDATTGNDGNDGLTPGDAWQTIAKVNGESFNAGDQILFKRGETWREQLTVSSSGASGNPITFDAYGGGATPLINAIHPISGWTASGNEWYASLTTVPTTVFEDSSTLTEGIEGSLAVGEWAYNGGTDRLYVRLSGDDNPSGHIIEWCAESSSIDANDKDWIIVENLELGVPWIGGEDGFGFFSGFSSENITVRDCTIVGTLAEDNIADDAIFGVVCRNGPVTITGNDISHCTNGISLRPGAGAGFGGLVDNNTIYNLDKGEWQESDCITVVANPCPSMAGLTISNNDLSLFIENGLDILGPDVVIEGNHIYAPHADAIDTVYAMKIWQDADNTVIRYNLIEDIVDSGDAEGEGIVLQSVDDCELYYNVIDNSKGSGVLLYSTDKDCLRTLVYNNTIVNCALGLAFIEFESGNDMTAIAKNNICDGSTYDIRVNGDAVVTGDYNCLVNDAAATEIGGGTYIAGGHDLGVTDPLFVNAGANNFHLQSGSPCRDAGTDVSLTLDYDGVFVPQEADPAIGAFEFRVHLESELGISINIGI